MLLHYRLQQPFHLIELWQTDITFSLLLFFLKEPLFVIFPNIQCMVYLDEGKMRKENAVVSIPKVH